MPQANSKKPTANKKKNDRFVIRHGMGHKAWAKFKRKKKREKGLAKGLRRRKASTKGLER